MHTCTMKTRYKLMVTNEFITTNAWITQILLVSILVVINFSFRYWTGPNKCGLV